MKFLSLSLIAVVFAVGCGGGSSPAVGGGVGGINIQVTSPVGPAAADAGLVLAIKVNVTGDSANAGVTWSVAPQHKGDPVGTLSDITPDSVTYNAPAPANVNAQVQVTVTATSVTDPTRAATIPISVYPALAITTQSSDLATAFLATDYSCFLPIEQSQKVTQIPCQANATGGLGPYTWSLANSALPDGLLLAPGNPVPPVSSSIKIVGQPTLEGVFPFSLTLTDSLGGTTAGSLNISVAPGQLKVVTPTIVSTVANVPYSPVAMQVTGGVPPYTWSLAPGLDPAKDLPPGIQLSPNGVLSGTPTTGDTFQFAIRVRDSQSPVPAEAIFPVPKPPGQDDNNIIVLGKSELTPLCQAQGSSLLPGAHYAFLFTGFDAAGPVTLSGSVIADGSGNLTGVEDIIRTSGAKLNQALTSGSSVQFDATGRGCLTLNTASSGAEFRVATTTIASGGGAGAHVAEGRVIEFDDATGSGTRGSGLIRIQNDTAFSSSPSGTYAFRFSGWDAGGGHFAMAGTATAESGMFTSVSADVNDGGAFSGGLNGGGGTIGSVDANGRGTATIGVGTATYALIFYVVDANHLVFNSTQAAGSGHPLITGEATTSGGPFSQASLSNSHIYRLSGHIPGSPDVGIGVLHFDGVGTLSGTAFARNGGSASATTLSGQYTADPNSGRFVFSGTAIPAVGYLTSDATGVTAFLVGTGASASSGVMEFQTDSYPPGYQFSPFTGPYGFGVEEVVDPQTSVSAGELNANLNGGLQGGSYFDSSAPPAQGGLVEERTYKLFHSTFSADGSGTFGGNTYMVSNGKKFFYFDISPFNGHSAVVVGQVPTPQ